jgi:RimJ/RimL family protein N-acetyltransferase
MTVDLKNWTPRPRPERITLNGRYVRLEPLNAGIHGDGLYAAATEGDAASRFRWLPDNTPPTREAFNNWLAEAAKNEDMLFYAVVDQNTNEAVGRQTLMRIDPAFGVIETGNIHWGPKMQRSPRSTEALYLHAAYVFDVLGYRRFEWKCNNNNEPSKVAALRFGFSFEGLFRNHMVTKGANRDTAWYAMIDDDWPVIKRGFERWLQPNNFDSTGNQIKRLEELRNA